MEPLDDDHDHHDHEHDHHDHEHDHHEHEHDHDHDYIDHHVDDYDDCEVIMQNSSDRNHLGGGGIIGSSLTHT